MARWSLQFLNRLISLAVTIALLCTALYAGFALWDNHRIYEEADSVFDEMRAIKARFAEASKTQITAKTVVTSGNIVTAVPADDGVAVIGTVTVPVEGTSGTDTVSAQENTADTMTKENSEDNTKTVIAKAADSRPDNADPTVQQSNDLTVVVNEVSGTVAEASPVQEIPDATTVNEPVYEAYGAPFDELIDINPDVNGWLTMPGTAIDYPLVQGTTNYTYLNKDVYGNFALTGTIYLDSRNDIYYTDLYSLLYGHNMSKHRMFGDVNLYKDDTFFEENREGQLFLRDREHSLMTLSCIVTAASDSTIFNPENWTKMTEEQLLTAVQTNALHVNEDGIAALQTKLENEEQPRILALSTCSNEFTDARTILLTLIDP